MRARTIAGAGLLAAGGMALIARRHFRLKADYGPRTALGEALPGGTADVPTALLQATGTELTEGNRVELLHDGDVFPALEEAIRSARHSVHVDLFIWKPGHPGDRIADLLIARAREGLAVRILVDPIGSTDFPKLLCPRLREAGCEVNYFRPPKKRPLTLTGRNHRKIVIVDGAVGFTGGFGIASEWEGHGEAPEHWRDVNVRVEGPVVRQLQVAFAGHWLESGGSLLPPEEFERSKVCGDAKASFVSSTDVKGMSSARWVTHIAFTAARRRLWIANAYFAPPPRVLAAMCDRSSAGVELRLLLPGPHQDHPEVTFIQRRLFPKLSRCGARVFEYQPSMMHAKTMLVDDDVVIVGSINLDVLSQELLEEGALVVVDRAVARKLEAKWEEDLARAEERTVH